MSSDEFNRYDEACTEKIHALSEGLQAIIDKYLHDNPPDEDHPIAPMRHYVIIESLMRLMARTALEDPSEGMSFPALVAGFMEVYLEEGARTSGIVDDGPDIEEGGLEPA